MILDKQAGPMAVRSKLAKEELKLQLKTEFGTLIEDPDGVLTYKSLKDYTREELWHLCQGAVEWLYEAGGDLGSLRIDFEELKQ